jgi:hypothetical protein
MRSTSRPGSTAEARLVCAERIAAVAQLSGALAHELRNPLHIIRATAETAASTCPEPPSLGRRTDGRVEVALVVGDKGVDHRRSLSLFRTRPFRLTAASGGRTVSPSERSHDALRGKPVRVRHGPRHCDRGRPVRGLESQPLAVAILRG